MTREDRLFELVDGVLVEKTIGLWESYVASLIATELNIWIRPRNLGIVTGADRHDATAFQASAHA